MKETSALHPVDPASAHAAEEEFRSHPVHRFLTESLTGRVLRSAFETLRSSGTNVVCLSPWGDSSPLILPCITFRDLVIESVIATTGGTAAIAAPAVTDVTDVVGATVGGGSSDLISAAVEIGFGLAGDVSDDLISDAIVEQVVKTDTKILQTTSIKELLITLKYKHAQKEAAVGFFRSSFHEKPADSLFTSLKDYIAIEKGWFSPYLFASGRRPAIPRSIKPDALFCHGPFLLGDYLVGQTLMAESAHAIEFCSPSELSESTEVPPATESPENPEEHDEHKGSKLKKLFGHSKPSSTPDYAAQSPPSYIVPSSPGPRRLILALVGIAPHRKDVWTTSQRPGESVMRYLLFDGVPSLVLPAAKGAPLLAWHSLTLKDLWKIDTGNTQAENDSSGDGDISMTLSNIIDALDEFVGLCIDWDRLHLPSPKKSHKKMKEAEKRQALKSALTALTVAAFQTQACDQVRKTVNPERAGIAMWRIP